MILFILIACMSAAERFAQQQTDAAAIRAESPCIETAVLLATTSGSPNREWCEDPRHILRAEVATTATGEEAAALVVCACPQETP